MTSGIVDTRSPSENHAAPACGCAQAHRATIAAFLRVTMPPRHVALEDVGSTVAYAAQSLHCLAGYLHDEGAHEGAALARVLSTLLEAQGKVLEEITALHVMVAAEAEAEEDAGEGEQADD